MTSGEENLGIKSAWDIKAMQCFTYCLQVLDDWWELHWILLLGQAHWKKRGDTSGPQFLFSKHAQRWNAGNIFVSQTAVAKENITEEEELVEDFGDGYFAPYQQVFRSARTSYRAFDFRPPVRPPATNFPEFIDELTHCRQASRTPQIVYFLKAHDVNYLNLDEN